MIKATHAGDLNIGERTVIPGAVLEDGTRVLTRTGVLRAIGRRAEAQRGRKYDEQLRTPVFLTAKNLNAFIDRDLLNNLTPILFKPLGAGRMAIGYKAELLPQICNVFLEAEDAGVLYLRQQHIAQQCKILIRGLAVVGITALVDEATGYQEVRDRLALQATLDKFLRKEFAKWAKRFPDEFYKEKFRLKNWQWQQLQGRRPRLVGYYTRDLVYDRLAPGLLAELEERNPKDETGHRKAKHHQWLTEDVGHPRT